MEYMRVRAYAKGKGTSCTYNAKLEGAEAL
jgi:hypothetical protein